MISSHDTVKQEAKVKILDCSYETIKYPENGIIPMVIFQVAFLAIAIINCREKEKKDLLGINIVWYFLFSLLSC